MGRVQIQPDPSRSDDAEANYSVSYMLQRLGLDGTDAIVVLAERGFVSEVRCAMPTCYCPGGRGFFEEIGSKTPGIPVNVQRQLAQLLAGESPARKTVDAHELRHGVFSVAY